MYFLYCLEEVTFNKRRITLSILIFLAKFLGIDPYEKHIDYPGGHAWGHVSMACSKLEAMAT